MSPTRCSRRSCRKVRVGQVAPRSRRPAGFFVGASEDLTLVDHLRVRVVQRPTIRLRRLTPAWDFSPALSRAPPCGPPRRTHAGRTNSWSTTRRASRNRWWCHQVRKKSANLCGPWAAVVRRSVKDRSHSCDQPCDFTQYPGLASQMPEKDAGSAWQLAQQIRSAGFKRETGRFMPKHAEGSADPLAELPRAECIARPGRSRRPTSASGAP